MGFDNMLGVPSPDMLAAPSPDRLSGGTALSAAPSPLLPCFVATHVIIELWRGVSSCRAEMEGYKKRCTYDLSTIPDYSQVYHIVCGVEEILKPLIAVPACSATASSITGDSVCEWLVNCRRHWNNLLMQFFRETRDSKDEDIKGLSLKLSTQFYLSNHDFRNAGVGVESWEGAFLLAFHRALLEEGVQLRGLYQVGSDVFFAFIALQYGLQRRLLKQDLDIACHLSEESDALDCVTPILEAFERIRDDEEQVNCFAAGRELTREPRTPPRSEIGKYLQLFYRATIPGCVTHPMELTFRKSPVDSACFTLSSATRDILTGAITLPIDTLHHAFSEHHVSARVFDCYNYSVPTFFFIVRTLAKFYELFFEKYVRYGDRVGVDPVRLTLDRNLWEYFLAPNPLIGRRLSEIKDTYLKTDKRSAEVQGVCDWLLDAREAARLRC